jgi:hypothetical protein
MLLEEELPGKRITRCFSPGGPSQRLLTEYKKKLYLSQTVEIENNVIFTIWELGYNDFKF